MRPPRENHSPQVHYGLIRSAKTLVKDAAVCDARGRDGIHCVKMEAAHLMNNLPSGPHLRYLRLPWFAQDQRVIRLRSHDCCSIHESAVARSHSKNEADVRNVTDLAGVKQQLRNDEKHR